MYSSRGGSGDSGQWRRAGHHQCNQTRPIQVVTEQERFDYFSSREREMGHSKTRWPFTMPGVVEASVQMIWRLDRNGSSKIRVVENTARRGL